MLSLPLLTLERTGLHAVQCVVIEDSANGVQAAKAAGMFVVATTNCYTEHEDLDAADIIVTCLGEPGGEKGILKKSNRKTVNSRGVFISRL